MKISPIFGLCSVCIYIDRAADISNIDTPLGTSIHPNSDIDTPLCVYKEVGGKSLGTNPINVRMKDLNKYFTERYSNNRYFINKLIKLFSGVDFEREVEPYHDLRAFIRKTVREWEEGSTLPDELIIERDNIIERIQKGNVNNLENQVLETNNNIKIDSEALKDWNAWIDKSRNLIKNYPRLEEETEICREILRFNENGKNIFDISNFLIQLLKKTEVGNIRFKDIILPYNCIYMHFGGDSDINLPLESFESKHDKLYKLGDKKFMLDGAFVSLAEPCALEILLCFKDADDEFSQKINIVEDYRFPTFKFSLDFGLSENETGKLVNNPETTFNQSTVVFNNIWESNSSIYELKYEKLSDLTKKPEECYEAEWEEYVLMQNAVKLIINCICFFNSEDSDSELSTTNSQASDLIKDINKEKRTREKNKLKEKLKKLSFSKIHFLGRSIYPEFNDLQSGNELDPHWRRGHWRNQPFGSGLTASKLVWIKPTIVRKDKGEPTSGHIYIV